MRTRITPRARADLGEIQRYLRQRSRIGARNVLRAIKAAIQFVGENPRGGVANTEEPSVRVKVVVEYPYKIFYRIDDDEILILHVRHSARLPWEGDGSAETNRN